LHDALPISASRKGISPRRGRAGRTVCSSTWWLTQTESACPSRPGERHVTVGPVTLNRVTLNQPQAPADRARRVRGGDAAVSVGGGVAVGLVMAFRRSVPVRLLHADRRPVCDA